MRQPVGICEVCGRHVHSLAAVNNPCGATVERRRCRGAIGSRLSEGDWEGCQQCGGTGRTSEIHCVACQGDGFVELRGRPKRN
jgi:DnaJ-class molecular chaperone